MNDHDIQDLQSRNAAQLAMMNTNAAGMVKSLLLDLGSNDTYIELASAQQHRVSYHFVEGTRDFVKEIGEELGLTVSSTAIEVPHA